MRKVLAAWIFLFFIISKLLFIFVYKTVHSRLSSIQRPIRNLYLKKYILEVSQASALLENPFCN